MEIQKKDEKTEEIITFDSETVAPAAEAPAPVTEELSPSEPTAASDSPEEVTAPEGEAPAPAEAQASAPEEPEKHPPVKLPAVQYTKSIAREKKISRKRRKKNFNRLLLFLLGFSLLTVLLALGYRALQDGAIGILPSAVSPAVSDEPVPVPTESLPPEGEEAAASPAPVEPSAPAETATPELPKNVRYEIHRADLSWSQARETCLYMAGDLAVIRTPEELNTVISLAEEQGVTMLWIGLRRVDGELRWVNGEPVDYAPWGAGEPSGFDSADGAAEDYVMLWRLNGEWCYNDSREDPVATYPDDYSGALGYVCRIEEP